METFTVDGVAIRYRRVGSGVPVVMLHNGGTSHVIWDDVVPRLEGYEVFALDLLGFGESAKPGVGYELERHVAILAAFIDAHELAPTYLVGNCMGSATSLAYAIARPNAVRAMVLINTLTTGTFETGIYAKLNFLPKRAPKLLSVMSHIPLGKRLGAFGVRSQLGDRGIARKVDRRAELASLYTDAAQSRALLQVLTDIPNYAYLDDFEIPSDFPPVCTIWGMENQVLPADRGKAFVDVLQPTRQEWLDGCGHLPMLEQPELVADIILEFFQRHDAAS